MFSCCLVTAQDYNYHIDLNQLKKDQLTVTLKVPELNEKVLKFHLPAVVPGIYDINDYGRLVSVFTAYNKDGKEMKVLHPTINVWLIKNASDLDKIVYRVHDSWDANLMSEPSGTNFYEDVFLLNHAGCFGFFEGYEDLPYELIVDKPENLYGGTSLQKVVGGNGKRDVYKATSYKELVDSPIFYTKPDTASFVVDSTVYFIQLHSPNEAFHASDLVEDIRFVIQAQNKYLGKPMPMERYAFLIYLADPGVQYTPAPYGWSALEHTYSSFYHLRESKLEDIRVELKDIVAHEFFHIWTPLTIRSKEIHDFDFIKPKMSKHLWLYEGATEYASLHSQVQNGTMSVRRFLNQLSAKVWDMERFTKDLPLTTLSENCLKGTRSQYGNVYIKGAIINMCLDIKLRELSNGAYGFQNMIMDLGKQFNREQPFDDDELFDIISELSGFPKEIRAFFRDHVEGSSPLPLAELLNCVGIEYVHKGQLKELFPFGFERNKLTFNEQEKKLEMNSDCLNSFGRNIMKFKAGDLLYKWQGEPIDLRSIKRKWAEYENTANRNDALSVTVLRKNDQGLYEELELKGKVVELSESVEKAFIPKRNISEHVIQIQNAWIGGAQ